MGNKKGILFLAIIFILIASISILAQKPKPRPKGTPANIFPGEQKKNWPFEPVISDFAFVVNLDRDGHAKVEIRINEYSDHISPLELNTIYERFLTKELYPSLDKQGPFEPIIIIRPAADLAYGKLVKDIEPLRKFGPNRIKIDVGEGYYVVVPARQENSSHEVKPDPLKLVVDLDDGSKILLNREPRGSGQDLEPLTKRLVEVFREREVNGVLREGVNEIEKTVGLRIDGSVNTDTLIRLAQAVRFAGSDQIYLELEPEVVLDVPPLTDSLLDSPPIPDPPKKNRPRKRSRQ